MTESLVKRPEMPMPPPISPILIAGGLSSGAAVVATEWRRQRLWLPRLGVVLAGVFAVLLLSWLNPSLDWPSLPLVPPAGTIISTTVGMKLVLVPAGEFLMGSPDSDKAASADEKPPHRVRITRPFYLGMYEVTQGQYRAVTGENPSGFKGSDDLPVESISWNDAIAFCNTLSLREGLTPYYHAGAGTVSGGEGYRLPTEAEWEYACRAGSTTRYSFGDNAARLGEYGWFDRNSGSQTQPVGQKGPNAFGLHDMHGNVWEWCWDPYDENYNGQSPGADPPGPSQAAFRVIRGGSWINNAPHVRSAFRHSGAPGYRDIDVGFRLARTQRVR
jgi:formylglycine-generating enzyme required for sulfatase activity